MKHSAFVICLVIFSLIVGFGLQTQPAFAQCAAGCTECRLDLRCQQNKLVNPANSCDIYYCQTDGVPDVPPTDKSDQILRLNIFGIGLRLNSEKAIQQLVTLGFSVFLGIVALVATFNGLVAAIKRTNTVKPEESQKLVKTMQNSIVGFVIVGMSFLIVQMVASAIGLGSLFSIVTFGNFLPEADDPTIQQTP